MLGSESVTNVLHALATGYTDRAVNVVAMSDELDEEARSVLWGALIEDQDPPAQARRFGDGLRSLGAPRHLVNECYRVSFYSGDEWKRLSGNPLFGFFTANRAGRPLDKWVHYFPIYDRHLERYRGLPIRVLEIGVYRGGGLELLHHYLGAEAHLVGIDIDEAAAQAVGDRYPVEIGDQEDPEFLRRVAERHGPFDVIIDDGGHRMRQQIVSVETLFPLLNDGGTYLVEDCHTSYWPEYADPEPDGPTFIRWLNDRIDDLHAYHYSPARHLDAPWQTSLAGLHLYDSVVVLDKERRWPPFSELSGTKEFINYTREVGALQLEVLATRDAAVAQAAEADARAVRATAEADTRMVQAAAEAEAQAAQAAAEADARAAQAAADDQAAQEELRILRGELIDAKQRVGELHANLDAVNDEFTDTQSKLLGSWGIIQEMRRSTSWRAMAPLRRVKSILTRR